MISTHIATKLFAVILLGQAIAAVPEDPSASVISDFPASAVQDPQERGEGGASPPNFLDSTGPATIVDIEANGMNNWLPILLGFQKGNDLWASSLFPQRDSREKATVRLFSKDKTRKNAQVFVNSLFRTPRLVPDFKVQKDDAWWTWALLEVSQGHAQDLAVLDIPQTIQTLSGVEAVVLEGDELKERLKDRKKLFDEILSKICYSPVWAKYEASDNYGVAVKLLDSEDQGPNSVIEFIDLPDRFSEIATEEDKKSSGLRHYQRFLAEFEPERLIYLKDLPRFENTTGEWVKA